MTAKPITPEAAARLVADGALLVDIREAQECAEVIEGAQNAPMSSISACGRSWCTPPGRK